MYFCNQAKLKPCQDHCGIDKRVVLTGTQVVRITSFPIKTQNLALNFLTSPKYT